MAAPSALAGLPGGGVFPLDFSESFIAAAKGKDGSGDDAIGLRYNFKPASITPSTSGEIEMDKGQPKLLSFATMNGSSQVFDIRDESSKGRECVLIWNPETASFTLTPLNTTLNLTLNRNLSKQPRPKRKSSSDEAASQPQQQAQQREQKKSRPSEPAPAPVPAPVAAVAPTARPTKGGKGLPRKSLPAPAAVTVPQGKIKSAEMIEDSDEEAEMEEVGAPGAGENREEEEDGDEEEEEEEEEEEDDAEGMDDFAQLLAREMSDTPPTANADLPPVPAPVEVFDDSSSSEEETSDVDF